MSKATYKNSDGSTLELEVLAENKDGTVNLGVGDNVLVENCVVSDEEKPGACVLMEEPKGKGVKIAPPAGNAKGRAGAETAHRPAD